MTEKLSLPLRLANSLYQIFRLLVLLYTAFLVIMSLAWLIAPQGTWWIAMSYVLAPNFFLLAPFVFIFTLFKRKKEFVIASVLIAVLYLAQFSGYFLPPSQSKQQSVESLKIVSFNQLFTNRTGEETLAYVKSLDVDFIVMQEVSPGVAKGFEEDPEIRERYPYQLLRPHDGAAGQAILSRIPFTDMGINSSKVRIQAVQFMHGQEVITLLNAHSQPPYFIMSLVRDHETPLRNIPVIRNLPLLDKYDISLRDASMLALIELIDQLQGNLIIAGDLNTPDRDPIYALLAERMTDAYASTNWGYGFTFPNRPFVKSLNLHLPVPMVRLDYVWTRGGFLQPLNSHVDCSPRSSDHCALFVEIGLGVDQEVGRNGQGE